jgi:hypothetical protein
MPDHISLAEETFGFAQLLKPARMVITIFVHAKVAIRTHYCQTSQKMRRRGLLLDSFLKSTPLANWLEFDSVIYKYHNQPHLNDARNADF